MKKLEKGFTLIELMIVVAIIAILAAVAAPRFGQQIKKAADAKAVQIVGSWRSGLNIDYADTMAYKTNFTDLENVVDAGTKGKTTYATNAITATVPVGTDTMTSGATSTAITITGSAADGYSIIFTSTGNNTKGDAWSKQ